MPTFTAIALDRLIETGAPKTMAGEKSSPDVKLDRRNSNPNSSFDRGIAAPGTKLEKAVSIPTRKLEGGNGTSNVSVDRKHHWTQISPALYATPEPTPLPDSPSSFPPSPYIINHKRRGPRLLKSFSVDDVATHSKVLDEKVKDAEQEAASATNNSNALPGKIVESPEECDGASSIHSHVEEKSYIGISEGELGINDLANGSVVENGTFGSQRDGETADDFFDPQESMSVKSNAESETNSMVERSVNVATPMAEFYDAWEELSSESGPQSSVSDVEGEFREIKLSLLVEIDRRKQAEESLKNTRAQWQNIREELSVIGLTLPVDLVVTSEDEQLKNPVQELSQQFDVARFVSNSIGRGVAKAEVVMEMEAQMELKNFEIARLLDRLHYYEAVNREMSQRNQKTIEISRRLRQRRKIRNKWIWGSVAAAITLGVTVFAWSYLPTGRGSSSTNLSHASEGDGTSDQ
ncbi:hypothetical protein ACH5RR_013729 [Cinchona calisaya]|uniref:Uncharacterized protein n=1 Tax=Cinchona calisaya TaxID=153742 RepID=A0ABD3A0X6_9GENT